MAIQFSHCFGSFELTCFFSCSLSSFVSCSIQSCKMFCRSVSIPRCQYFYSKRVVSWLKEWYGRSTKRINLFVMVQWDIGCNFDLILFYFLPHISEAPHNSIEFVSPKIYIDDSLCIMLKNKMFYIGWAHAHELLGPTHGNNEPFSDSSNIFHFQFRKKKLCRSFCRWHNSLFHRFQIDEIAETECASMMQRHCILVT